MTRVVTCPQCAAQLAVPELAATDAQANCPFCESKFVLDGVVRTLRSVTLVDAGEQAPAEEAPFSSEVTLRGGLADMPTLSTLFERFRDTNQNTGEDDAQATSEMTGAIEGGSEPTQDPFDFDTSELGIERQPEIDYQPDALEHVAPVIAAAEREPAERAIVAEVVSVAQGQKRRSRGSRSFVRQMVGVVGGGVIGLTLGYFALLWWRGPDGDLLGIADSLPAVLLPDSFEEADRTAYASHASEAQKRENEVEQATFVGAVTANPETSLEQPLPPPVDPQDAKPLVAKAEVRDPPHYTIDQLNVALGQAEEARTGLLTGSLADPAVKQAKGKCYVILCQAAETLTFVPEDSRAAALRQAAAKVFESMLRDGTARDEIGQIALRWIEYPSRPHGGIFFAGKVLSSKQVGGAFELELELPGGQSLAVLTPNEPFPLTGALGVVGSIVENPAERIAGYGGAADRAVWSRMLLPLE